MKTALLTLNVGNVLRENSRQSFQSAARRWGCDYIEVTVALCNPPHATKLKAFELCDADRVFYVDADTIISGGCPSPFELFPDDAFVACQNQQEHVPSSSLTACLDTIARDFNTINSILKCDGPSYPKGFINSGIWLASRKYHLDTFQYAYDISILCRGKTEWKDQSALNYALISNQIPVLEIPPTWNFQFPPDTGQGIMEKFIYHWAGGENRSQIDRVNWQSFRNVLAEIPVRPKLLLVADFCCHTGFARVAENICKHLVSYWDISIIGLNYQGQPHSFPYQVWPAKLYGDIWGMSTLRNILSQVNPDIIMVLNDPWIVARFASECKPVEIPMVGYMPVDAKNQNPEVCKLLNNLDLAIFYTKFGELQCRLAGFKGNSTVIPHGVDLQIYYPVPQDECRSKLQIFEGDTEHGIGKDAFIVGNVNRNQPRKRLDLTIQYFAEWIKRVAGDPRQRIDNAYLYLHCSQQDTVGLDLAELAHYYGIGKRIILPSIDIVTPSRGLDEEDMKYMYGCLDIQVSTTAGEGWGLSQIEGMACGIPQIIPQYAALGEWAVDAAYLVPVAEERIVHPVINTIGAVPEKNACIHAMDLLYHNRDLRNEYSYRAVNRARNVMYRWDNIASVFHNKLVDVIRAHSKKNVTEKGKENGENR
jgi:D-inositol-3-phosphate glycosyltransferase